MKMAFVVCNSFFNDRLTQILKANEIDYFTNWDNVKGKGHGTEPHLGSGAYPSTNTVTMIAFEHDAPLAALIRGIQIANQDIPRATDHIRLFQMPLDQIV